MAALVLGALILTGCGTTANLQAIRQGGTGLAQASGLDGGTGRPSGSSATSSAPSLAGAASTSASSSAAGGADASSTVVSGSAGPTGVSSVAGIHAPIQLGFLDTETGNASAFGANAGNTFTGAQAAQAIVDAFNKHGGIAGRHITAVIAKTDTATADWNTDFSAACAKFTQDNKVSAVLGYTFVFLDAFESCLNKAGVVHLDDGYNVGDAQDFRTYPLHFGLANPSWDRHYLAQLEGPLATGYVTTSSRLGILLSDCPYDRRAWAAVGAPFVQAHHLTVADTETLSCVSGANGDGAAVSQISSAVLKFRSARVDRVVAEGVPVVLFGAAAESQGWRPGYVVTSWTGGAVIQGSGLMPTAQEENVHGFGWLPIADVGAGEMKTLTPSQTRCLALYREEGLVPHQYNDYLTEYTFCDAMFLYETALRATGGRTDPADISRAVEQVGSGFGSVTTFSATFGAGRHDAPAVARPWAWDARCGCFTYQGAPQPIS